MPIAPYRLVVSGRGSSPLVAHIPHASTRIPPFVREQIVLDDDALQRELVRLTDWHADHLFSWVLDLGGTMFVNELSRLVFDPERFAHDAEEPMAACGQGVVYTHGTDGQPLARVDADERARRIRELYEPYHEGPYSIARCEPYVSHSCGYTDIGSTGVGWADELVFLRLREWASSRLRLSPPRAETVIALTAPRYPHALRPTCAFVRHEARESCRTRSTTLNVPTRFGYGEPGPAEAARPRRQLGASGPRCSQPH